MTLSTFPRVRRRLFRNRRGGKKLRKREQRKRQLLLLNEPFGDIGLPGNQMLYKDAVKKYLQDPLFDFDSPVDVEMEHHKGIEIYDFPRSYVNDPALC